MIMYPEKSVADCEELAKAYQEAAQALENLREVRIRHRMVVTPEEDHAICMMRFTARGWYEASREEGRRK